MPSLSEKKILQCLLHEMAVLAVCQRLLAERRWSRRLRAELFPEIGPNEWRDCLRDVAKIGALVSFRAVHHFLYHKPGSDELSAKDFGRRPLVECRADSPFHGFVGAIDKYVAHITRNRVTDRNSLAGKHGERRTHKCSRALLEKARLFLIDVKAADKLSALGRRYHSTFHKLESLR